MTKKGSQGEVLQGDWGTDIQQRERREGCREKISPRKVVLTLMDAGAMGE